VHLARVAAAPVEVALSLLLVAAVVRSGLVKAVSAPEEAHHHPAHRLELGAQGLGARHSAVLHRRAASRGATLAPAPLPHLMTPPPRARTTKARPRTHDGRTADGDATTTPSLPAARCTALWTDSYRSIPRRRRAAAHAREQRWAGRDGGGESMSRTTAEERGVELGERGDGHGRPEGKLKKGAEGGGGPA